MRDAAKMEFKKAPQELIDAFDAVIPSAPAEKRMMFGYPTGFVNGNMFMGMFGDRINLRLPENLRDELIALGGKIFEPMTGRPMREYVELPASILTNRSKLSSWVKRAFEYGSSLPPKKKKPAKKSATAAKKVSKPRA
jgi:TfoX/Sxy family transcriptional regulator of competence genes